MNKLKQIERVLDAVKAGADTSPQVAEMTGLSVRISSAWIARLIADGRLKKTGKHRRHPCSFCNRTGRMAWCVEVVEH